MTDRTAVPARDRKMTAAMRRTPAALATALAFLALPAAAGAEDYYVPSGNSAVNQYSESFPTAGGEKGSGDGGQEAKHQKTIGAKNVEELEAQGPAGTATAELAEQTAPTPTATETSASSPEKGAHRQARNGANHDSSANQTPRKHRQAATTSEGGGQASSSSGFGEVASKAFGISPPGDLGALLPLILLASLAGAVAYRLKIRNGPTG